jgi:hypothetical protein
MLRIGSCRAVGCGADAANIEPARASDAKIDSVRRFISASEGGAILGKSSGEGGDGDGEAWRTVNRVASQV